MSTNLLEQIFAEKMEQRFAAGIEQGVARGIEQGVARGIEQGVAQGRVEGERVLLRRFLERRFGAIPPALEVRIATMDAENLTALFDRALAATTIDAL